MQAGVPYRLWLHVRTPTLRKKPGVLYVQFTNAVDRSGKEIFRIETESYLTLRGPEREKWAWVGRDLADPGSREPVILFRTSGEVTVRVTAGEAGVAFDQFVLSPGKYFEKPPSEAVIPKPKK